MLTRFVFESQEVRFVDGKPVANDVAKILGYADPAKAISTKVDSDYKGVTKTVTPGGTQLVTTLDEPGIYQLIFGSKLPVAEKFRKWIFEQVLPSIRKTGSYSLIQTPPPKKAITYYTDRVMDLKHSLIKSPGTWCVIEKCSHLLLEVERLGYQVNQFDLLDGSVGTRWGKYRKGKSWACVGHKATYKFPDNRGERIINAYEYPEIGEFMIWLDYSYEPQCLPEYLEEKYGTIVKV